MEVEGKDTSGDLEAFQAKNYYTQGLEYRLATHPPQIILKQIGVDLVLQYYTHKYYMERLIKIYSVKKLVDEIMIARKQNKNKMDLRIPYLITGPHSTPVIYAKENGLEAILILDSINSYPEAKELAEAFPHLNVYTPVKTPRQWDAYSCHTDAQVMIRELAGKDKKGNYLIADLIATLEKQKVHNNTPHQPPNLHIFRLFGSLLLTVQYSKFRNEHEQEYHDEKMVHVHKGQPEDILSFLARYPAEQQSATVKDPIVSNYLREKGLKYRHIIEIQFYINQLQAKLGDKFTTNLRDSFIVEAKKEISAKAAFLQTVKPYCGLYAIANKYFSENKRLAIRKKP